MSDTHFNSLIASEAFEQADITLSQVPQRDGPAPIKKAGHYTFWIRKLKPFMVMDDPQETGRIGYMFFNETASILFGIQHMELAGYQVHLSMNLDMINDLYVGLRYSAFSPTSIAAIFQTLVRGQNPAS
ncbi:hypothetical protein [Candidatus Magnetaquiglobus chichijimensis]|uniref:hypothetical protein n=1 Tax=Candidatus Magnetaquiglobus chichijimensis TaxID=3141448 RepID=UPI003B976C98